MSCNGCRVLRKGCSESCVLRQCLRMIESPEAQGHATLFVAKFFGRAGLMSFVSAVPEPQRPALFQSLLFEACGRTINPVNGAVGLLWSGNWHLCQAAVETVLRGGTLRPLPQDEEPQVDCFFEAAGSFYEPSVRMLCSRQQQESLKRPRMSSPMCEADNEGRRVTGGARPSAPSNLELRLSGEVDDRRQQKRPGTPSEESGTTCAESGDWATAACQQQQEQVPLLLNLFA